MKIKIEVDEDDYREIFEKIDDAERYANEIFKNARGNGIKADADEIWHLVDRVRGLLSKGSSR